MELSKKEKVAALLKSFETKDPAPLGYVNPDKYIQHNVRVADGTAGLKAMIDRLPEKVTVNIVRIFEDGDYVFAHSEYYFTGWRIGFDIFRFEDELIVEHWDNLQARELQTPGGHSMTDGPVTVTDKEKTGSNKAIVRSYIEDIMGGRLEKLPVYYDGDRYIQHNPWLPDGFSGLANGLNDWAKQGIRLQYEKIHRVLGEGCFVLAVSECHFKGVYSAFYDLYRIDNGKIAEHWDTIEEIPAEGTHKNGNGKF